MARLRVRTHEGKNWDVSLEGRPVAIGKLDARGRYHNDVAFEDETVSRRHARVVHEGTTWTLEDLGSMNQTFVNDRPVLRTQLRHGDRIQIGLNFLEFEADDAALEEAPRHEPGESDTVSTVALGRKVIEEEIRRQTLEAFVESLGRRNDANRALLDANPDLMLQVGADSVVTGCKLPDEITFFSPRDVTGLSLDEFLPGAIAGRLREAVAIALRNQELETLELERPFEGVERFFEIRLSPSAGGDVLVLVRDVTPRVEAERERERVIEELREALARIKTLRGLVPICANCKKVRDDRGFWKQLEHFVQERTDADFSHGTCPKCRDELYGEYLDPESS